ncbi:MAG: hypothetical protein QOI55_2207, partial [Actinomycetota bacterium]|nr:hypothetical protein [Actinomycetota bacterium]
MPFGRARRRGRLAVLVAMVVAAIGGALPATADTRNAKPVLSLTVARHIATFVRFDPSQPIDIGAYVASRNAPFEIQIRRKDYTSPVKAFQVFHHGNKTRLRALPSSVVSSTSGLKGFLRLRLTNAHGTLVYDQRLDFCPDG